MPDAPGGLCAIPTHDPPPLPLAYHLQMSLGVEAVEYLQFKVNDAASWSDCTAVIAGRRVCQFSNASAAFTYPWTRVFLKFLPKLTLVGDWGQSTVFTANCFDSVTLPQTLGIYAKALMTVDTAPTTLPVGASTTLNVTVAVTAATTANTFLYFRNANSSSLDMLVPPAAVLSWSTQPNGGGVSRNCDVLPNAHEIACNLTDVQDVFTPSSPGSIYVSFYPNNGADLVSLRRSDLHLTPQ